MVIMKSTTSRVKKSKSSNQLMVLSSHSKLEDSKSAAPHTVRRERKIDEMFAEAEELLVKGEFETALVKFSQGALLRPKDANFAAGVRRCHLAILNDLKATGDVAGTERPPTRHTGDRPTPKTADGTSPLMFKSSALKKALTKINDMNQKSAPSELCPEKPLKIGFAKASTRNEPIYKLTVHDGDAYKTIQATAQDVKEYLKDKDYFQMTDRSAVDQKKLRRLMNRKIAEEEAKSRFEKEVRLLEDSSAAKSHCEEQVHLIGRHYQNGRTCDVIRFSENLLKYLAKRSDKVLPRKWMYYAAAYNYLAKALADEGDFEKAKVFGEKLYKIAINANHRDLLVQSYILSGKIYVKFRKLEEAALVWQKSIPLIDEPNMRAWLFHEIGRCYFEMGKYEESRKFGEDSAVSASNCASSSWSCSANVLLGQVEMKRSKYKDALEKFVEAEKHAEIAKDAEKLQYVGTMIGMLKTAVKYKS